MKKTHYLILALVVFSALILSSCDGSDGVELQPVGEEALSSSDSVNGAAVDVESTELPAQATEDASVAVTDEAPPPPPEELPDIPTVKFGPGDAWFRATNPSEIQLAAGKVQVFKFSASW
jgi:hypothetical protein